MKPLDEQLKTLPDFDPPPGAWARLDQALAAPRVQPAPSRQRRWLTAVALAAGLVLALRLAPPQTPSPAAPAPVNELAQLIESSQQLERQLAEVRHSATVWDSRHAQLSAELEGRLQLVDLQLAYLASVDAAEARPLWENRVALMSQLVSVHRQPQFDAGLAARSSSVSATEYRL